MKRKKKSNKPTIGRLKAKHDLIHELHILNSISYSFRKVNLFEYYIFSS